MRPQPLIALLTIFLSRVEDLKQTSDPAEAPALEELDKWYVPKSSIIVSAELRKQATRV